MCIPSKISQNLFQEQEYILNTQYTKKMCRKGSTKIYFYVKKRQFFVLFRQFFRFFTNENAKKSSRKNFLPPRKFFGAAKIKFFELFLPPRPDCFLRFRRRPSPDNRKSNRAYRNTDADHNTSHHNDIQNLNYRTKIKNFFIKINLFFSY